ncbi:MAG: hypothetical protein J6I73_09955 [Treponema sp.]|nr:hypothetical protein [Treponema sp.]
MSDATDNTRELDSYGVWIKHPPTSAHNENDFATDGINFDADLPDFSDIEAISFDNKQEKSSTLTTEELSNVSDAINAEKNIPQSDEISFDDFSTSPVQSNADSESVDINSFDIDFDNIAPPDSIPDMTPLDIDLSFDSSAVPPHAENAAPEQLGVDSFTADTFELPAFDSDISEPTNTAQSSGEKAVSVTADNFDDMFDSIQDESAASEEIPSVIDKNTDLPDTEDIDVSAFGIDVNAEEMPITNIAERPKRTLVDYDLSVSKEDGAVPVASDISNIVPDSFDEEAQSLTDSIAAPATQNNELLEKIVADLSGLKEEIADLKNEFAELKTRGAAPAVSDASAKGGFFSDMDEDETISLSGDELDNIMNTANFSNNDKAETDERESAADLDIVPEVVPESRMASPDDDIFGDIAVPETPAVDESVSNLTIDFDENLTEPDIDNFSSNEEDEIPEELPEEIAIPKVDDILVESAQTDFIDSIPADNTIPTVTEIVPEVVDDEIALAADSVDIDDFFKVEPSVAESLTKDNIDYLNSDTEAKRQLDTEAAPKDGLSPSLKEEIKSVLLYMDHLLESLPEEKIVEFARSEQFAAYKKLFAELGLS